MSLPRELSDAINAAIEASDEHFRLQIEQLPPVLAAKARGLAEKHLLSSIFQGQGVCDHCGEIATVCRDVLEAANLDENFYASFYACDNHLPELLGEDSA